MLTRSINRRARRMHGVSLIEVAIALVVISLLISIGMPSYVSWIENVKIRATAESLTGSLQNARTEAIRANTTVIFQLTDTQDNSCAVSTAGKNWVVSLCPVAGKCAASVDRNAVRPAAGCGDDPLILAKGALEGANGSEIFMSKGAVCFSGLGRVSPASTNCPANTLDPSTTGGQVNVNVEGINGSCVTSGGEARCLRLNIASGGQIRLCDPAVTAATDPRKC